MSQTLRCSCGQQLSVQQWHAGMKVRCPKCQTVLVASEGSNDPRHQLAADALASAAQSRNDNDSQTSDGPPAWVLGGALAFGVVLLLLWLFTTPGRLLTGVALLITGVPLMLAAVYSQLQSLFNSIDCEDFSLIRRFSKLLFLAGIIMSALGLAALFGK